MKPPDDGDLAFWAQGSQDWTQEQIFEALCSLLPQVTAQELFLLAPVLGKLIPELAPTVGFDQRSPHHAYDLFTHIAYVTEKVPGDLVLRWAALLHDTGKVPTFTQDETGRGHFYGHAKVSAQMANTILLRMQAPDALRERVTVLIEAHMTRLKPDKDALAALLHRFGRETLEQMLLLQEADMGSKGTKNSKELAVFSKIRLLLEEIVVST